MRALRSSPRFEQKRIAGLKNNPRLKAHLARATAAFHADRQSEKYRQYQAALRASVRRPEVKAKKAAAMRKENIRRRGGRIPDGYESLYKRLKKHVGAKEALRMVRIQRDKDFRLN